MAVRYLILCVISTVPSILAYDGFYYRDAAGVGHYGLEGLSMDIMEKIKKATGHPINTYAAASILSAQPARYGLVKFKPYKKVRFGQKARKKDGKGSTYKHVGGGSSSGRHGDHYTESGRSGSSSKGKWGKEYDESSGSKGDFMHESEFTDDHYHKEEGRKGDEFKGGRKKERAYLSKGYEDVYHKDETKKSDSFWDNEEKEGKWLKYGSKKKKNEKKGSKKTGKKEASESKEGKEYKVQKGQQTEKKDQMSAKKEDKKTTKGEYSKKDIEITETKN